MPRFLVTLGIIFVAVGLFWQYLAKLGLGKLPGDIMVGGQHFVFYFPLTTSILVSVALTIMLRFVSR